MLLGFICVLMPYLLSVAVHVDMLALCLCVCACVCAHVYVYTMHYINEQQSITLMSSADVLAATKRSWRSGGSDDGLS